MVARFWRWLFVCAFALTGALGAAQVSAAAQQPDGVMLVKQLEQAGQYAPERYAKLTLAEKQAVLRALTPAYTTVRQTHMVFITAPTNNGITLYSAGCWAAEYAHRGYSTAGVQLWTFLNHIEWCGDGSTVTTVLGHRVSGTPDAVFWFYNGIRSESDLGGTGQSYYAHYAQGDFQLCLGGIKGIGCVQDNAPYVEIRGYGNGTATATYGG